MKALILKDFFLLQKQLKIVLVVMLFYAVLFVPQGMMDMMPFMAVMFGVMYVMTTMSFDETQKWDRYALCGPLSRLDMVRARYLTAMLLVVTAFVFGLLCYVLLPLFITAPRPLLQSLATLSAVSLVGLLWLSVIIPLMYKFGAEKGRLLIMGAVLLPVGAVVLFSKYAPPALTQFLLQHINYFLAALLLLVVVALFISYKISLRIYNNKEF